MTLRRGAVLLYVHTIIFGMYLCWLSCVVIIGATGCRVCLSVLVLLVFEPHGYIHVCRFDLECCSSHFDAPTRVHIIV